MACCEKFTDRLTACTCGWLWGNRRRNSTQKRRRGAIVKPRRGSVYGGSKQYKFYEEPKTSPCCDLIKDLSRALTEWPIFTFALFTTLTIVNCTNIFTEKKTTEAHEIVEVFGAAVVFLLGLAFNSGISKYKEILRMYDEITGDIKALAMIMVHLTFDREKYYIRDDKLKFKKDVQDQYKKIKYLLASIAPTVKNVLTGEKIRKIGSTGIFSDKITPIEAISERSYYEQSNNPLACLWGRHIRIPNYWKDSDKDDQRTRITVSLSGYNVEPPDNRVQRALYEKINNVHTHSNMDAFECTMTVLLDELMRVFENGLGFGSDEGSAIATSAIEKWNAIYGTWGSLSSLKTFREPFLVSFLRILMLSAYAWFTPTKYSKYVDDQFWFYTYSLIDVWFFAWLNWISYAIRNPFKDNNRWIIDTVDGPALQTQSQVIYFMSRSYEFDSSDYKPLSRFGYIVDGKTPIGFEKIEEPTLDRILKAIGNNPSEGKFKIYLRDQNFSEEIKERLIKEFISRRARDIEQKGEEVRLHYRGTSLEF